MTDPYPFRPDHVDAGVTAMHAERRALISQVPSFRPYDTHPEPPRETTDE